MSTSTERSAAHRQRQKAKLEAYAAYRDALRHLFEHAPPHHGAIAYRVLAAHGDAE